MSDPFPDEGTIIDKGNELVGDENLSIESLVYPKERYKKGVLPM
jgi:hypothetical protein